MVELDIIKKPYSKDDLSAEQLLHLLECIDDPLYFAKNFAMVQHPIKGMVKFDPYPYQIRLIKAFHDHRFVVGMCARQSGKSLVSNSIISYNKTKVKIKSLLKLNIKQQLIDFLETILLKLAK